MNETCRECKRLMSEQPTAIWAAGLENYQYLIQPVCFYELRLWSFIRWHESRERICTESKYAQMKSHLCFSFEIMALFHFLLTWRRRNPRATDVFILLHHFQETLRQGSLTGYNFLGHVCVRASAPEDSGPDSMSSVFRVFFYPGAFKSFRAVGLGWRAKRAEAS